MPIVLARVDNRLVHGQILSAWMPALAVDQLLVLDDEAAADTLVRSAMEIAIPPDVTFDVVPLAEAPQAVQRLAPRARTMVLWRDVADATRAVQAGVRPERLNLGNVHFAPGRAQVSQAVYLSPDEVALLEQVEQAGVPVELKTLPRDTPLPLSEIKRRVQAGAGP